MTVKNNTEEKNALNPPSSLLTSGTKSSYCLLIIYVEIYNYAGGWKIARQKPQRTSKNPKLKVHLHLENVGKISWKGNVEQRKTIKGRKILWWGRAMVLITFQKKRRAFQSRSFAVKPKKEYHLQFWAKAIIAWIVFMKALNLDPNWIQFNYQQLSSACTREMHSKKPQNPIVGKNKHRTKSLWVLRCCREKSDKVKAIKICPWSHE